MRFGYHTLCSIELGVIGADSTCQRQRRIIYILVHQQLGINFTLLLRLLVRVCAVDSFIGMETGYLSDLIVYRMCAVCVVSNQ